MGTAELPTRGADGGDPFVLVGRVREFTAIVPDDGEMEVRLSLVLPSNQVTQILLRGVEGLDISSPFSGWPVTLQLVETSHRQWDRLGFEVTDAEEGSLRCWCRELVIDGSPAFG